jgi:hypothetical protein
MGRNEIDPEGNPPSPESRPQGGDWRRILPGLAVSVISLGLVFYFADVHKLGEALRLADYRYALLAILITLIWLGVRGIVWRTLLQDKAPYSAVFWSLNEGYLLNNLLPFRLGEVGRSFLLSRKSSLDFWQVLSTVIVERLMDLAMAAGLLMGTLPFVVGATWARQAAVVTGLAVILVFAVLYLLARNQAWALGWFDRLGQRWPWLLRLGGNVIPSIFSGLSVMTDGLRFLRAIAWILVNWLVAIGQYTMMVNAFFPGAKLLWAAFSLGVAALGIAAPSSPGAVGVMELSIVGALSLFGLDASVALAMAITIHVIQYLVTGVLGAYALAREGESLLDIYHRVRKLKVSG